MFKRFRDWEPCIGDIPVSHVNGESPGALGVRMRRWIGNRWVYRAPTEQEMQDYLASEAW